MSSFISAKRDNGRRADSYINSSPPVERRAPKESRTFHYSRQNLIREGRAGKYFRDIDQALYEAWLQVRQMEEKWHELEDHDTPPELEGIRILPAVAVIQIIALSVAIIWGAIRKIPWWHDLSLNGRDILFGLLLGASLAFINFIAYKLGERLPFTNFRWVMKELLYPAFKKISPLEILLIACLSGICEESLFRGVMFKEWGLIVSSVIFGALHTGSRKLIVMGIWTGLLGCLLGYSYMACENLIIPMIAHGINNLINLFYLRYFFKADEA